MIRYHGIRRIRFQLGHLNSVSNFCWRQDVQKQFSMLRIPIRRLLSPSSSTSLSTNPLEFCSKNVRNLWLISLSTCRAWGLRRRTLWVGQILLMASGRWAAIALRDYHMVYISNRVVEYLEWLENLVSLFGSAILLPWTGTKMIPYNEADLNGQLSGIPRNLTSSWQLS